LKDDFLLIIWLERSSELGVEDLRGHLANANSDIFVVLTVGEGGALSDALDDSHAVGEEETGGAGSELTVLLVVVEGDELVDDSSQVRPVTVTINNLLSS